MVSIPAPVDILGLSVHPVTMNQAVVLAERFVAERQASRRGRPFIHVALNGPKWIAARDNPGLREHIAAADLVTADGVGILAMARRIGAGLPERVTGIDLMDALCARAAVQGWPIALVGGENGVALAASTALRRRYRELQTVFCHHGFFDPQESPEIADAVASSGAKLLFVGMNTPRKEDFALRWGAHAGVELAMGVGGAFDVLAGRLRRAPGSLQGLGLEWAWRWAQEPRRLARRYGWDGARFALATLRAGPAVDARGGRRRSTSSLRRAS